MPGKLTEAGNPAIHRAKTATLTFTRPRGYDHLTDNELEIAIQASIARYVAAAHETYKNVEGAFPGRWAVLRMSRRHRATSPEPKRGAKRVASTSCVHFRAEPGVANYFGRRVYYSANFRYDEAGSMVCRELIRSALPAEHIYDEQLDGHSRLASLRSLETWP